VIGFECFQVEQIITKRNSLQPLLITVSDNYSLENRGARTAVTGLNSRLYDAKKPSIISLLGFRLDIFWAI
jgi:hypothetical protein